MGRLIIYPYDNTIPYDKARTMKPHALSSIHKSENIDNDLTHKRNLLFEAQYEQPPLHRTVKLKPTTVFTRTKIESPRKHELTQTTIGALNKNVTELIKFVQDKTADYLTPESFKKLKTMTVSNCY